MTERLPEGADPTEVAEERIDALAASGGLQTPEAWRGRPLDLSDAGDPDWWVKRKLRQEQVALPPALQLRRDRDELLARLDELPSEHVVRDQLTKLDARIRYAASHVIDGPPSTLMPLDVDGLVAGWRARRPPPPPVVPAPAPAVPRWRRVLGIVLPRRGPGSDRGTA